MSLLQGTLRAMPSTAPEASHRTFEYAAFFGVVGLLFALPYVVDFGAGAYRYVVVDALIVAGLAWRGRVRLLATAGLRIPWRHALAIVACAPLLLLGADALFEAIRAETGVGVRGHRPWFSLSQVFHQELVLRGLLLGAVAKRFGATFGVASGVAGFFALLHPLLFWYQGTAVLPWTAVASLFLFGLATNLVFFRSGHIGFCFALHAAWNLRRFGAEYGDFDGRLRISEAESFAVFEGSGLAVMAGLLGVAAVLLVERALRKVGPFSAEDRRNLG